ncbi:LysR substrate-binding domain-containing protein [Pararhizobium sp.]|uniref:LysR substrate-binding domain-containing protein n=1 Tax=Pararhizobium sp. TaxID=1977563 RepID=UPI0027198D00|nr:LysR substrate-binding domain-containing protein [Pararhizobium sp.]MDO9414899.1 LysR substrate-binding domain-containing protein [Pararhizobium sp.]
MKLSIQLPLNALRAFEAAQRHGSFTKAAAELGTTQTAISYQIKLLEDHLGEPLFLRRVRQISLTAAGERLAPKVTEAFGILKEAMVSVRDQADGTLLIQSTPTFAQQWLTRHLGAFQLKHPSIAVRLSTGAATVDFAREPVDVAIRWGTGTWPGLMSHRVMKLDFTPMLSPKLAASFGGIREPSDLLKLPIISAGDPWWGQWFAAAGVENPEMEKRFVNDFGVQTLDAGAAMAGQGVAIINPKHYETDIALGNLIQPFELLCNDGRDYWLVYQESRRNIPKIRAFREWLLSEINAP